MTEHQEKIKQRVEWGPMWGKFSALFVKGGKVLTLVTRKTKYKFKGSLRGGG